MKIYEIKGLSGLFTFLVGLIATLAIVVALPSAFLMVLWNAVAFEGFGGPEIALHQGLLLWLMALLTFKIIFKPEIVFELKSMDDGDDLPPPFNKPSK